MPTNGLSHVEFCWSSLQASLIGEPMRLGSEQRGEHLRCETMIHLSSRGLGSFGCIAWKCAEWTAGFPCGGIHYSSHSVRFPLQRPQYEQHQSAAPGAPSQPSLPRGAVSITEVMLRPVRSGHIPMFVFHTCCGNLIKQDRKAVSTNNLGTWGNT